jgi:hypothetical protein
MNARRHTKFVREGSYAAEVDVELIEEDNGWSPYLSLDDARKLDAVREALRREDLEHGEVGPDPLSIPFDACMSAWPSTRARRVLAAFLRIGWTVQRQSGSHRTLSRPEWLDFVFAFRDSTHAT